MAIRVAPIAFAGLTIIGAANAWLVTALIAVVAEEPAPIEKVEWTPQRQLSDMPIEASKPIGGYHEILARPLFFKTREPFVARPIPAPPPPVPKPPAPPPVLTDPGISVGGIMISGPVREAYLQRKPDPNGTWVREGADYMGWKVQFIDADSAKLQQSDRTIELRLYVER